MPARFQTIRALSLKPPSEHERSFDTYLHYLQSLSGLCFLDGPTVAPHPGIVQRCMSTDSFKRIARKPNADLDRVGRLLRNAWTTEVHPAHASLRIGHLRVVLRRLGALPGQFL